MGRVVVSELLHRRSRTLALLLGILVATTGFTVLTGTSETQVLEARGTVAKSFRGDYDVLVRPRGSRNAIERAEGQVRPNFLSGTFGGISFEQWRKIQRTPGVEVAAPIANIGYLLPTATIPIDVSQAAGDHGRAMLRARIAWRSDRGLTRVRDVADYVYVTPNRLEREPENERVHGFYASASLREYAPGRNAPLPVCFSATETPRRVLYGPWRRIQRMQVGCYSRTGIGRTGDYTPLHRAPPTFELRWSFPLLLTAIDPESEAKLTGLDRGVVAGRALRGQDGPYLLPPDHGFRARVLPVLAASRTYLDEQAEIELQRMSDATIARWIRPFVAFETHTISPFVFLMNQPGGPTAQRVRVSAPTAYAKLLQALRTPLGLGFQTADILRVAPARYGRRDGALVPGVQQVDSRVWQLGGEGAPLQWAYAPPAARDTRTRSIKLVRSGHVGDLGPEVQPPLLKAVGTFDPDRLGGAPRPGAPPLTTLQPPQLTARDEAATRLLGGQPLRPNGNLGGYLTQPPALLTTMRGARAFGGVLFPSLHPDRSISAVRVRVAGVTGIDAVSRERIREAAERIATGTGLDVDITAGASGAPTAVDLPAGLFGRPRLALSEVWIRKGVAARVLTAVDRKSLLLFVLILVVCALFVANAAGAAVRARRRELGMLACLGWSTSRLFAVVLAETAIVGFVAGVLGGLLALPLAVLVGVQASVARALLAVPAATLLALLAGVVPAARAARATPLAAVAPIVLEARRTRRPRGPGELAFINVLRTPGRTAVGALSLAIGIYALTLLLAATVAFHDALVGTLLGDAVAVDIHGSDVAAVVATVLLGAAAVGDVVFLNLRERAGEFATLVATGWDDAALARLVITEGVWVGGLGALTGAVAGLASAAQFAGALPLGLVLTTAAAAVAGTALSGLAAFVPVRALQRTPAVPLLADE